MTFWKFTKLLFAVLENLTASESIEELVSRNVPGKGCKNSSHHFIWLYRIACTRFEPKRSNDGRPFLFSIGIKGRIHIVCNENSFGAFRIGEHSVTVAAASAASAVLLLDPIAHTFGVHSVFATNEQKCEAPPNETFIQYSNSGSVRSALDLTTNTAIALAQGNSVALQYFSHSTFVVCTKYFFFFPNWKCGFFRAAVNSVTVICMRFARNMLLCGWTTANKEEQKKKHWTLSKNITVTAPSSSQKLWPTKLKRRKKKVQLKNERKS